MVDVDYYELVTDPTEKEIPSWKSEVAGGQITSHGRKNETRRRSSRRFQGAEAGHKAAENFQRVSATVKPPNR